MQSRNRKNVPSVLKKRKYEVNYTCSTKRKRLSTRRGRTAKEPFEMSEQQNKTPETADSSNGLKPESSLQTQSCGNAEDASAVSGGLKPKLKTLWRWFNVVVDYIVEEDPNPPKMPGPPPLERSDVAIGESALKKCRNRLNAFFDFLEEGVREPKPKKTFGETLRGIREDCRSGAGRVRLLKSAGGFCWRVVYLGTILIFLFAAAMLGTVKTMEYIAEHRVKFYPSPEVVQQIVSHREALEDVADRIAASWGGSWRPSDPKGFFDVELLDTFEPIMVDSYTDEYGVYLVTSRDRYSGEHGIFIPYDAEKMPPRLNWGLIEGRVFTYAIFDWRPSYAL